MSVKEASTLSSWTNKDQGFDFGQRPVMSNIFQPQTSFNIIYNVKMESPALNNKYINMFYLGHF